MAKKQLINFGGFFLPSTSIKIPGFAEGRITVAMAMSAFFALPENKLAMPKYDILFQYHS